MLVCRLIRSPIKALMAGRAMQDGFNTDPLRYIKELERKPAQEAQAMSASDHE
jgi:hypothetical protein